MAKKAETISLIDTFAEFKETKNIDRATLVSVLEESFRSVIAKLFGSDDNYDVIVNPDKGDFEIYRNRTVVADGEVKDDNREISLTEARQIDEDYEVGEEVSENVDFAKFGRRAILTLRQTLASKILELEHDSLYNKYKDRVGDIDQWIIDALKSIGMETAKDVLNAPREMLVSRADLEEETVDEVLRILGEEFEEE